MSDSLETHAVSYAHELEIMIRQKNAEIERLRADLANKTEEYERMWSALQAETTTSVQVRGELRDEVERLRGLVRTAHDNADYIASKLRSYSESINRPVLLMKAEAIMALEALIRPANS